MLPNPEKANYKTTEAILEEIPALKEYLGKNIIFNGDKAVVRVRKKTLNKKTLLYLWDMSRSCYLSSLYPQNSEGLFLFEVGGIYYYLSFTGGTPQLQEANTVIQAVEKAS